MPSCRHGLDGKMPFSPNPFLPLLNIQRRFGFLGTQMRYFAGNHIRFGRSFTFQGAYPHYLFCSKYQGCHQPAQMHCKECVCADWRRCRNVSQFETYFRGTDPDRRWSVRVGPFWRKSGLALPPQISGGHIQKFAVGRLTV